MSFSTFIKPFGEFALALWPYSWAIITGLSPVVIMGVVRRYRRRIPSTRVQHYMRILLLRRNRYIFVFITLFIGISYSSFRAFSDVTVKLGAVEAELSTLRKANNLKLTLVVDNTNPDEPNFHLELLNTNTVTFVIYEYYYHSEHFNDAVILPDDMRSELPPGTPITLPGKPYSGITNTPVSLEVIIEYGLKNDHVLDKFSGVYSFFWTTL